MLGAGCWILDTGYWILIAFVRGYRLRWFRVVFLAQIVPVDGNQGKAFNISLAEHAGIAEKEMAL